MAGRGRSIFFLFLITASAWGYSVSASAKEEEDESWVFQLKERSHSLLDSLHGRGPAVLDGVYKKYERDFSTYISVDNIAMQILDEHLNSFTGKDLEVFKNLLFIRVLQSLNKIIPPGKESSKENAVVLTPINEGEISVALKKEGLVFAFDKKRMLKGLVSKKDRLFQENFTFYGKMIDKNGTSFFLKQLQMETYRPFNALNVLVPSNDKEAFFTDGLFKTLDVISEMKEKNYDHLEHSLAEYASKISDFFDVKELSPRLLSSNYASFTKEQLNRFHNDYFVFFLVFIKRTSDFKASDSLRFVPSKKANRVVIHFKKDGNDGEVSFIFDEKKGNLKDITVSNQSILDQHAGTFNREIKKRGVNGFLSFLRNQAFGEIKK